MATIETAENGSELILQTHYYKATYDEVKKVYLELLDSINHNIISVNDDFGEICSEIPHFTVIAKIIQLTEERETSIDFYINAEYLVGNTGKAKKFLDQAYKKIEESFEFKGVSLHK